jgi:Right handed beta helix region
MKPRRTLVAVAVVAATAVPAAAISAVPVRADDPVVQLGPHDDIQAALDAAGSGATIRLLPGTYRQAVMIERDDVTLKGSGAATVLTWPAALPGPAPCTSEVIVCLTGNRDHVTNVNFDLRAVPSCASFCGGLQAPTPGEAPTTATVVDRVTFIGDGNPMVFGADVAGRDLRVERTRTFHLWYGLVVSSHGGTVTDNSASGDCAAVSVSSQQLGLASDVVVRHNRVEGPLGCPVPVGAAIAVEDAPGTIVEDNRMSGIDQGVFVSSSSRLPAAVTIRDNDIVDSCQGVLAVGPSAVEVRGNRISGTVAPRCFLPAVGVYTEAPDTTVADNRISVTVDAVTHDFDGNLVPASGIYVATGGTAPDNDRIVSNRVDVAAGPGEPAGAIDLFWDRSGDPPPLFQANRCQTSTPALLCGAGRAAPRSTAARSSHWDGSSMTTADAGVRIDLPFAPISFDPAHETSAED